MIRKTLSRTAMLKRAGTDTSMVRIKRLIPRAARTTRNTRNTRKTRTIRNNVGDTLSVIKLSKTNPVQKKYFPYSFDHKQTKEKYL